PIRITGLRLDIGSWKIIDILPPRILRNSRSSSSVRSLSSKSTSPSTISAGGMGKSRRIESDVTLLPEPLSPTMPIVSPSSRSKLTPLTAWTLPSRVLNWVLSPFTSRIGAKEHLLSQHYDSGLSLLPLRHVRVERITQAIADKIEAEHGNQDGGSRQIQHQWIAGEEGLRLAQQHAPA